MASAACVERVEQYEESYYVDDEEPQRHDERDDLSQRSASLESVKEREAKAARAKARADGEAGPLRAAREAQVRESEPADYQVSGQALPPGAIAQDAPFGGPVEDATPPSPSPGVRSYEHVSVPHNVSASFHNWKEEVSSFKGEKDEEIRVFCGVWNLHGKRAPADLHAWIPTSARHHIYAIGTCECERTIEKAMIWSSKARWEKQMQDYFGKEYLMIGSSTLSAVHIMVFLHRTLWKYCSAVETGTVATGFCNVLGNKGSTQVSFRLGNTSMLFLNCHLAAHQNKMQERTQSLQRILESSPLRKRKDMSGVHREFDRVFLMGDLNTRVDASRDMVDAWISAQQLDQCLAADQLLPLLKGDSGHAGLWPDFREATIHFPPTYKFDKYSEVYDSSKKRRVPSWTDRILWKKDPAIKSLRYDSVPSLQCSDHRPVFSQLEVTVDLNWSGPTACAKQKSSVCAVQ